MDVDDEEYCEEDDDDDDNDGGGDRDDDEEKAKVPRALPLSHDLLFLALVDKGVVLGFDLIVIS